MRGDDVREGTPSGAVGDILTARALADMTEEEMAEALRGLAEYSAERIARKLREGLEKARGGVSRRGGRIGPGIGGCAPGSSESTAGGWIPIFRPAIPVPVPSTSSAMPYIVYKVIHYLGIFLLVVVLGASMGRRVSAEGPDPLRKRFAMLHGLALFLVLLGGFGLLARINVQHGVLFPGWVWVKLVIWVILGGIIVLARRRAGWAMPLLLLVPVLAMLAGYVAYAKPF